MTFSHEFKETMSQTWVIRLWPRYTDYIQDESGYPTLKGESYKLVKSKCDKRNGLVLTILVLAKILGQDLYYTGRPIPRKKENHRKIARQTRKKE